MPGSRNRASLAAGLATLAACSFVPMWEVLALNRVCGLGYGTTLWHMPVTCYGPDPSGGFTHYVANPATGVAVTLIVTALVALPTRWLTGRLERIEAQSTPDSIAGTLRPAPAPPR